MKILEFVYVLFLSLTREDNAGDRHKRAAMLVEMVITFVLAFFIMCIFGLLKIQVGNFVIWIVILGLIGLFSYFILNNHIIKSKLYLDLIKVESNFTKRKKFLNAFSSILILIFSVVLLILGGVLMSYYLGK